ncbi:uncharacterized protein AAES06_023999 isoform 1-T1 [Glossophaga mutica]
MAKRLTSVPHPGAAASEVSAWCEAVRTQQDWKPGHKQEITTSSRLHMDNPPGRINEFSWTLTGHETVFQNATRLFKGSSGGLHTLKERKCHSAPQHPGEASQLPQERKLLCGVQHYTKDLEEACHLCTRNKHTQTSV